jgi:DNA-binding MarR family transcriptional regulator
MTDQLKECHCANIRSGSRKLSQFYDTILAPAKIRLTQFTILRQLYYAKTPHPTVMNLAVLLDTDRTTLGRNLAVLKRHGLVFFELDRDDRRV